MTKAEKFAISSVDLTDITTVLAEKVYNHSSLYNTTTTTNNQKETI
jgi:hypothetical protein